MEAVGPVAARVADRLPDAVSVLLAEAAGIMCFTVDEVYIGEVAVKICRYICCPQPLRASCIICKSIFIKGGLCACKALLNAINVYFYTVS